MILIEYTSYTLLLLVNYKFSRVKLKKNVIFWVKKMIFLKNQDIFVVNAFQDTIFKIEYVFDDKMKIYNDFEDRNWKSKIKLAHI